MFCAATTSDTKEGLVSRCLGIILKTFSWEQSRFFCSSKNWKLVQVMQVMQEIQVLYCKSSKRNQSYTSNTINTSYTSNRSNTSNTNNASIITYTSCKYMSKWVNEIYFPTYSETNYYRFLYWPRWIIYFQKNSKLRNYHWHKKIIYTVHTQCV